MIKFRAVNIFLAENQMGLAKGTSQATNKQQQLESNILACAVVLPSNDFKGFSKAMNHMEWNDLKSTSYITL